MDEDKKYKTIKKLVDTNGNKQRAAVELNCSKRHINRMIKGYKEMGKEYFVHGNRGRKPVHTINDTVKQLIVDLYQTKYYEANITHFVELLSQYEGISVSASTVRALLKENYILSPLARKSTKKKLKEELRKLKKNAKTKKEEKVIQEAIIDAEDAHPRRPRCVYAGEMIQMDASIHEWFGGIKTNLHIAVDDATGAIVGAYFACQETLEGYYNILKQVLTNHGIPYMFFTDKRTVFEYNQKKSPSLEEDTFTQFGYACKQLGIEIKTSSIPQAKGRVERMFHTLQSRLPLELRLANVNTIEQANEFLNSYIKKFNARFALPIDNTKSVFEMQPDEEKINLTLAVITGRKVDNGSCIKFKKKYYIPVDRNGRPVHYRKGTSGLVIEAFNGELFFCVNEIVYALDLIPEHEISSKNFDTPIANKEPVKRYIPSMNHPWKKKSFDRYLQSLAKKNTCVA